MTFIERMKKDKNYRFKIVLIGVIIMLIIGNSGESKKEAAIPQATCDLANTATTHPSDCTLCMPVTLIPNPLNPHPTDQALETCAANLCFVGTKTITGINTYKCLSMIPNGWRTDNSDNCIEDSTIIDAESDYGILCKAFAPGVDPSTRECNSAMEGIGSIVQQIAPDLNLGCRSAFYITVFGGAMIIMFIFASI